MSHEGICFVDKEHAAREADQNRPLHRIAVTPEKVRVLLSEGKGLEIDWQDGHKSAWSFAWLRDACPCAMCNEEREKSGRKPGEPPKLAPGMLPMFKAAARPVSAEGIGKYAIRFAWNDDHDLGIYSWRLLREICPCEECKLVRVETGEPA